MDAMIVVLAAGAFVSLIVAVTAYAMSVLAWRNISAERERDDAITKLDRAQAEIRALEDKLVRLQCQNGLTPGVEQ